MDKNYPYHDIYECRDCKHTGYYKIEDCCRKPRQIITINQYGCDKYFLYFQCFNCGGSEKTKPLKSKDYSEQIRSEFNVWRFDEWKAAKSEESNSIYESLRLSNYKKSKAYKYHQYLNSDEWKARRLLVLTRDGNLCQSCNNEKAEDIHHLSYDNLFNEPLEDLQALCRECHINLHRKEFLDKYTKTNAIK